MLWSTKHHDVVNCLSNVQRANDLAGEANRAALWTSTS